MKKRILSILLVACMLITMLPVTVLADEDPLPDELDLAAGKITIENGTSTGTFKVTYGAASTQVDNIDPSTTIIITQTTPDTSTSNIIEISADVPGGVNIKLNGVNILGAGALKIFVAAGKVNLILADYSVNTLTATGTNAGLRKNSDDLLTISCEHTGDGHTCNSNCGKLIAVGGGESAGIGSGRAEGNASNITISGGNVGAFGGSDGAGIGGASNSIGEKITISGGNVTATGGASGAGIGGGEDSTGRYITISGGNVTATGGTNGAGIGGGEEGTGNNITISGGHITATGGANGAGIGGGWKHSGSAITISGGIVSATGKNGGAGIGGGAGYKYFTPSVVDVAGGSGSNITISGGTVRGSAISTDSSLGHGIGGGDYFGLKGVSSNIKITGGNVYASSIGIAPQNDSAETLYKATFSIPGDTTGGTTPDAISFNRNNSPYIYGMNDTRSILDEDKGKLFVYLPVGTYSTVYGGKTYTAEVDNSGQAEFVALPPAITAFNFNELTPNVVGAVDEVNKTIGLTVPYGTNVTALIPSITHTGTSVSPNTGAAQNFTSPVTYTVASEDDSTEYTVTVTVADPLDITAANVVITAPVLGAAPQDVTAVEEATNHADYTLTGLTWNEALTEAGKFKAGQVYTATVTLTSKNGKKFQTAAFTPTVAGSSSVGTTTTSGGDVVGNTVSFTVTFATTGSGGGSGGGGGSGNSTPVPPPPAPVITVSEVKSELFENTEDIKVEADVTSAFGQSVEVKITDSTESEKEVFSLAGADDKVYPFDISLYSKGSNNKVQPKDGYSVKITIPVPQKLLEDREQIKVVYGKDGKLDTLKSELIEKDGKWYIIFEATHFSPYALVVSAETEPSVSWTNPFSDVKESDLYYSAVQYVAQNSLMFGTGSNIFSPQLTTNRGMIATILYRLSGSSETFQSTFKDVIPGAYYANAVAWAQEKGIIAGYGNGMFGPEDSITREQMATILWRYAGSPLAADSKGLTGFMDVNEISLYAKDALAWIYEKGIFEGQSNGILDPKGKVTRAEVAQIMYNFIQKADLTE